MRDLIGTKSGKLTVVSFSHRNKYRDYWNCTCECGNSYIGRSDHLQSGKIKSCGCSRTGIKGHRTDIGWTSFVKLYCNYKSSAKKRQLEFSLTQEQFHELIDKNCFYCGSPPSGYYEVKGANGGILYNGIDRIYSRKCYDALTKELLHEDGYVLGNVVTCCGFCNRAKYDMPWSEFLLWLKRVKSQTGEVWEHLILMESPEEVSIADR